MKAWTYPTLVVRDRMKTWLKDLTIKTVATFAQTLGALLMANGVAPNILHIAWTDSLGISAGAALLCVLSHVGELTTLKGSTNG